MGDVTMRRIALILMLTAATCWGATVTVPYKVLYKAPVNNTTAWTAVQCTLSRDTSIYQSIADETQTFGSLKMLPSASVTYTRATLTSDFTPVDVSAATHLRIRYYVGAHSTDFGSTLIMAILYSEASQAAYRIFTVMNTAARPYAYQEGWHTLIVPITAFDSETTGAHQFSLTTLLNIRLQLYTGTGTIPATPIYFDQVDLLARVEQSVPIVALNVDDGNNGGGQILAACVARNIPVTCYIIPSAVGKTIDLGYGYTEDTFMGLDRLKEFKRRGVLFCNHTWAHVPYFDASLTPAQFKANVEMAAEWMRQNGFGDGAELLALPKGQIDKDGLDAILPGTCRQVRFVSEGYAAGTISKLNATISTASNFPWLFDLETPPAINSSDKNTVIGADTTSGLLATFKTNKDVFILLMHAWGAGVGDILTKLQADRDAGLIQMVTMDQLANIGTSLKPRVLIGETGVHAGQ